MSTATTNPESSSQSPRAGRKSGTGTGGVSKAGGGRVDSFWDRPLDTTTEVVTPENIAFEYQLAGPFRRLPAYLIDVLVRYAIIFFLAIALMFIVGMIAWGTLGAFAIGFGLVSYFLISWFYGAGMETYFNGRTVGKWSCGIRVIDVDGCPITGRRAIIRNLLRIADLAPLAALSSLGEDVPPVFFIPTGMVGLVCVICTSRMQRLGDIAAGTMVIIDEKTWRLPTAKVDDPRVAPLASFIPGDYAISRSMARTLAVYVERRHYLTPARRLEIARHLTLPLLDRFDFDPKVDADLLMMALYHKTFIADPSQEPADLGVLAGYSPLRNAANPMPAS
ncbi:RDD family protein [Neorhodopirellula lusitana]|uniref:RDD family protein n=1 Tax=Neorhodopirellula lusitana TaxID=445327 RepID=UPI00384AD6B0